MLQTGIGPETADSILLYVGHHPIFVVDAYTRRVLERHDAIHPKSAYDESQLAHTYNEMHDLFVQLGKHCCLKQNPKCEVCPLRADAEAWADEIAGIMGP